MTVEFDPRILRIGLEIDGQINYYEGLYITAQGTRYGTDTLNECQIRIDNLTKEHRNFILNATSPYRNAQGAKLVHISVEAGRKSYGPTLVYYGAVSTSVITQPPEIGIILNCQTCYDQVKKIISYNTGPKASLRSIAQKAADELGLTLNFQASDKQITNFSVSADALEFIKKLSGCGNLSVTVDNKTLIVKDDDLCILGPPVKKINEKTGMIGVPEFIQSGVRVKYLFDNSTVLYQNVLIESILNPTINGNYQLFKLSFDLANRATPFYWIAECQPTFAPVTL